MLLDTCALLWLTHEQENLSPEIWRQIDEVPILHISAATSFEIGLKARAGKLLLPVPPRLWLETVLAHHDISVIDLDMDICIKATELPHIHKDPCDRFIIATALVHKLPVVTVDERYEEYGIEVLN